MDQVQVPAENFRIAPPENFNCAEVEKWSSWIKRFDRYRNASGLRQKG
uniref:Uncharacterized protein n=1 Tax=Anguilla anguilla TaxID=7936 RepID=A0A0E9PYJ4_ANGAN